MQRVARVLQPRRGSSCVQSSALLMARRGQGGGLFHVYLNHPHVTQPDNLDSLVRTKEEQQTWLNTEQWEGYSNTYLQRPMTYNSTFETNQPESNPKHRELYACLKLVYELYGTLAEELQQLHDDPLQPGFHARIARIKRDRAKIAAALDAAYPTLHPTVKTVYDAFLVRRYYHLRDWITYVERKRARLFERLSPEYVEQLAAARAVSEQHIERLKQLGAMLTANPTLGLASDAQLAQFSETELATLRQRATYFRKMRLYGANQLDADTLPQ